MQAPFEDRDERRGAGATPTHGPEHETALAEWLGDERPRTSADLTALTDCATCRSELERLSALRARLDVTARSPEAVLAAARASLAEGAQVAGEELVGPFVRERLARRRQPLRLRLVASLATAAAALLVFLGWRMRGLLLGDDVSGRGVTLGERDATDLEPSGAVEQYAPLRWPMKLPIGGRFAVRVWDPATGDASKPLYSASDVRENLLWPPADETATWPDEIEWEVQAFDATDIEVGAPRSARARRSRTPHER